VQVSGKGKAIPLDAWAGPSGLREVEIRRICKHSEFVGGKVVRIRTDLQEVGCGYMVWIGLAQDRDRWRTLVSAVMNLGVP